MNVTSILFYHQNYFLSRTMGDKTNPIKVFLQQQDLGLNIFLFTEKVTVNQNWQHDFIYMYVHMKMHNCIYLQVNTSMWKLESENKSSIITLKIDARSLLLPALYQD